MPRPRKPASPFRYFNSSPEVIRLVVMMYVRFPLSLRNVEDLLFERGIDLCHETVRMWWNRFGPLRPQLQGCPTFSHSLVEGGRMVNRLKHGDALGHHRRCQLGQHLVVVGVARMIERREHAEDT